LLSVKTALVEPNVPLPTCTQPDAVESIHSQNQAVFFWGDKFFVA